MFDLFLNTETCPDGVELVDVGPPRKLPGKLKLVARTWAPPDSDEVEHIYGPAEGGKAFRFRTQRRRSLQLKIDNFENPVVVAFVNAKTDDARARFLCTYGMLMHRHVNTGDRWLVDRDRILDDQNSFAREFELLGSWSADDRVLPRVDLQPILKTAGKKAPPKLQLDCRTLGEFMTMETALMIASGVRMTHCQHCHVIFVTGPLTRRGAHAQYCRDRCRVAAMRARQARRA